MTVNKSISLLLACILMTSVSACANGEASDTTAQTGAADQTTPANETTAYADAVPELDFGGEEFRISVTDKYRYEIDSDEATGEVTNDAVYERNKKIEDRFNVTITSVVTEMASADNQNAHAEYVKRAILAGDDAFDLAALYVWKAGGLILDGCFIDWNTVRYVNFDNPWWVQKVNDSFAVDGKLYAAVSDLCVTTLQLTYAFLFNKQIAESYLDEDLYTVVDEGRWTVDYLYTVSKDVYADLNANDKHDKGDLFGFVGDVVTGADAYLPAFNQPLVTNTANGLEIAINTDRTVEALEKVYKLYYENDGAYIPSDYWEKYDIFKDGQSLFIQARLITLFDRLREMEIDFGILPYPKFNEAQEEYLVNSVDNYSVLCIPTTVKDLDRVGAIVEALSAESRASVIPAFYDTALQTKFTRDERSADMLDLIMNGRNYDLSILHGGDLKELPYLFRTLLSKRKSNFTSEYEASRTAYESAARDLYEKYKALD